MADPVAAGRYAEALFEIAWSARKDREFEGALTSFSQALRMDPAIEKFLGNPSFGLAEKKNFLKRIYSGNSGIGEVLLNFFTMLIEKNRFGLVHEIAEIFKKSADHAQGEGAATIRSAVPLEAASEAAIVSRLEKIAGYQLKIKKEVDPSLLGGVVVNMDYKVLDGSVIRKIRRLEGLLKEKSAI